MSEEGGRPPGGEEPPAGQRRHRLDPDRAAAAAAERAARRRPPPPVIDTRPYQRMIGLFGLTLVIIVFVGFLLSNGGTGTAGIPAGKRLHFFAAPLATSNLNGDANTNPPCTLARHDPRALNVCLMVKQAPLVLAFFVTNSSGCERQVDALQALSTRYPSSQVQFAAVAVRAGHADARRAVARHHWTIPVAFDPDGAVGEIYGVEVCPIVELAYRGGTVARRLIGEHWDSSSALATQVQVLLK